MQKDYHDMTDKEKLIYVLEDIGTKHCLYDVMNITLFTDNDYEVEFGFNEDGSFVGVVAY